MTLIAWLLVSLGTIIGLGFTGLVWFDVNREEHRLETISQWFLAASTSKQFLVCSIALFNALIWGALFAHLVWAKNGNPTFWLIILGITFIGLIGGGIFGNYFFGQ